MNSLQLPPRLKATIALSVLLVIILLAVNESQPGLNEALPTTPAQVPVETQFVPPKNFVARAALVYDITTYETLFEHNADLPLPAASLTKVMTALLATEKLSATSTVALNEDHFPLPKLIKLTLLASVNDGAEALAGAVTERTGESFVSLMNQRARELGLNQTFFLDASGLDWSSNFAGGYSSAHDLAKLFAYIIKTKPALLEVTKESGLIIKADSGRLYFPENTNEAVSQIPDLLASKTGTTPLAGGNLVTVFDRGLNQPVIALVLGSTEEGRFDDVVVLVQSTYQYYEPSTK